MNDPRSADRFADALVASGDFERGTGQLPQCVKIWWQQSAAGCERGCPHETEVYFGLAPEPGLLSCADCSAAMVQHRRDLGAAQCDECGRAPAGRLCFFQISGQIVVAALLCSGCTPGGDA